MINIHHLELFYYVARHQGIVNACRHIPYGVQQPAVSAQLIKLEEEIGATLFQRRPFRLTEAGKELYDFASPFFGNLPEIEARLRGRSRNRLRIVGLSEVMRAHAPELLASLKRRHPNLELTVVDIDQQQAEELVLRREADIGITVLSSTTPPGLRSRALLKLPLGILVRQDAPYRTAAEAIRAGVAGRLDLISLPPHELLPRLFAAEMRRKNREWPIAIQLSSTDMIAAYVGSGLGAGLSVDTPHMALPEDVRMLSLKNFPSLVVGAFWADRPGPVAAEFLAAITAAASSASQKT